MKPLLLLLLASALPLAAAPAADKSGYSLAHPVPAALLRDLATDRPDATESPFTIDAGHAQLELDLANFTRNHLDGTRTTTWGVAPFNLRLGLLNNLEAGLFVAPYGRVAETPRGGPRTSRAGFGDVTLRAKINFWGNDGGENAFGVIGDVTLPTAVNGLGNDYAAGTLTFPVALELAGGWEAGAMTQVACQRGTRSRWSNSVTVGHALARAVSGYVELTSSAGEGAHVATFDTGVAWKLDANTQLDCGVNLGLSRSADDLSVFAGMSRRF